MLLNQELPMNNDAKGKSEDKETIGQEDMDSLDG